MKKLFTIAAICFTGFAFSQSINTKETNEKFSTGSQNAVVTTIFENNANDVISEWKKVLKDYNHEMVKESDNEVFGDNILVKEWGNNPVDFYTKFEEDKKTKTLKMSVAVDLGGTYLSSSNDKDKIKYVEKMVKDFAINMTKEPINAAVKLGEKQLGKFEDEQKDLEKENKNLKGDIEDYKKKIEKAEKEIKTNEENQAKKKIEIETQKKAVAETKKRLDGVK
jgi:vacuolar-type H+-ATPase subunit I/STV1